MRKRLAVVFVVFGALGLFSQGVAQARTRTHAVKVPPVCVERNLPGNVHLQIGYCPG